MCRLGMRLVVLIGIWPEAGHFCWKKLFFRLLNKRLWISFLILQSFRLHHKTSENLCFLNFGKPDRPLVKTLLKWPTLLLALKRFRPARWVFFVYSLIYTFVNIFFSLWSKQCFFQVIKQLIFLHGLMEINDGKFVKLSSRYIVKKPLEANDIGKVSPRIYCNFTLKRLSGVLQSIYNKFAPRGS